MAGASPSCCRLYSLRFGLWIRLKLEDTPVFKAIEAHGQQPDAPIREVFSKELRPLIAAVLCRVGPDVLYALFTVFTLTYGIQVLGSPAEPGAHRRPHRVRFPAVHDSPGRRSLRPDQPPARLRHRRRRGSRLDLPLLRHPGRQERADADHRHCVRPDARTRSCTARRRPSLWSSSRPGCAPQAAHWPTPSPE